MPVILSDKLIKEEVLKKENIFTINKKRAQSQDIRPLKLAIVNLMPNKEVTEIDLLKLISANSLQIEVDFIRTVTYKNNTLILKDLKVCTSPMMILRMKNMMGWLLQELP